MKTRHRPRFLILIVLLCLAGAVVVIWARAARKPVVVAHTGAPVTAAAWRNGSWYWLEGAETANARLVRAPGESVAAGDHLNDYAAGDDSVVWTDRADGQWELSVAGANGAGKRRAWTGADEPHGLCISAGRVFWLLDTPAAVPDSGALPPLGSGVQIMSMPLAGGTAAPLTTLMEPQGKQVVGVHGGSVFVSVFRPDAPGVTAIYRVALNGGPARRVASEVGSQNALLTADGTLYWTGPSQEDMNGAKLVSVRRLGSDDRPETLADWLLSGGKLYETVRGVCYLDGGFPPAVWPIRTSDELPRAHAVPPNYHALALRETEMLLEPAERASAGSTLYRAVLP